MRNREKLEPKKRERRWRKAIVNKDREREWSKNVKNDWKEKLRIESRVSK